MHRKKSVAEIEEYDDILQQVVAQDSDSRVLGYAWHPDDAANLLSGLGVYLDEEMTFEEGTLLDDMAMHGWLSKSWKKVKKQVSRSTSQVKKQVSRSAGQVKAQVKRSGAQIEAEAKRAAEKIERELKKIVWWVTPMDKFKAPPIPPAPAGPPVPGPAQRLVVAIDKIPWVHPYMRSALFAPLPSITLTPFYEGVQINDYKGLMETGYFTDPHPGTGNPRTVTQMQEDTAVWLVDNLEAPQKQFDELANRYIAQVNKAAEEWQKEAKKKGYVASLITTALNFIPVVGNIVSAAASAAYTVHGARVAGKAAILIEKKMQKLMNIPEGAPEKYDNYVEKWMLKSFESFDVEVNGTTVATTDNATDAAQKGLENSKPGDTVAVTASSTPKSQLPAGFFIRSKDGVVKIAPEYIAQVSHLTPDQRKQLIENAEESAISKLGSPKKGGAGWLVGAAAVGVVVLSMK